jgi:1-deoxy-D-xylulose-5-phosphate reductoisomerase
MRKIALLGATGSIGRQAIEIVEAHPELELCAVASGSSPLDHVDAPLKQVGGDLAELLERAAPDVVLNAVVGFAGVHATLWALEHGVDLALANKESLVAAGELATEARARGGGRTLPVDSEHSALFQCLDDRPSGRARSCSPAPAARSAAGHATSSRRHAGRGACSSRGVWARRSRSVRRWRTRDSR